MKGDGAMIQWAGFSAVLSLLLGVAASTRWGNGVAGFLVTVLVLVVLVSLGVGAGKLWEGRKRE